MHCSIIANVLLQVWISFLVYSFNRLVQIPPMATSTECKAAKCQTEGEGLILSIEKNKNVRF